MNVTRKVINVLFALSLSVIGILECIILQDKISLIPFFGDKFLVSKWWYLINPIGIIICYITLWFYQLCWQVMASENGGEQALEDLTIENVLKITSSDIIVSLIGILMLSTYVKYIRAWNYSNVVYSYAILWLYVIPFISATLEFFSSFSSMENIKPNKRDAFKEGLLKNGLITMILMLINLILLIWVADMTVCKYTYILYLFALIARKRNNSITFRNIWPYDGTLSEEARNEGIK